MDTRGFCERILACGDLATKLAPPPEDLADAASAAALRVPHPARDSDIAMRPGAGALPRPGELGDPGARAVCLARFAHHELMAVELFAWALLRWPALPGELRRAWLGILADEQKHCRLYLERLEAHGSTFSDHVLSDYFWQHEPALDASAAGARGFLAAMGLTLEQANLDFSLLYRDAFRDAGDAASADVCQQVHDDELRHVRLAATWLERLTPGSIGLVEAYETAVPFPLSAARAKGRRFDAAARARAGLDSDFVEHVRAARSTQEARPGGSGSRS